MNLDRTFCTSKSCNKTKECDRHTDKLKEASAQDKQLAEMLKHRPISIADFSDEASKCKLEYIEHVIN